MGSRGPRRPNQDHIIIIIIYHINIVDFIMLCLHKSTLLLCVHTTASSLSQSTVFYLHTSVYFIVVWSYKQSTLCIVCSLISYTDNGQHCLMVYLWHVQLQSTSSRRLLYYGMFTQQSTRSHFPVWILQTLKTLTVQHSAVYRDRLQREYWQTLTGRLTVLTSLETGIVQHLLMCVPSERGMTTSVQPSWYGSPQSARR